MKRKERHSPNHLSDKFLLGRLPRGKQPQQSQKLSLVGRVRLELGLFVDVNEQSGQIATAAALTGLEKRLGNIEKNVGRGAPARLLDIPGGYDTGLLLCLVELALGDALLQARNDLVDLVGLARHDGWLRFGGE